MKTLIPDYILSKYAKKKFSGDFEAITMFIDISGFTAMTQSLMHQGKEGAEVLTEIINRIFTPSIQLIYEYNGYITTFAGDAFTSVFPTYSKENKEVSQALFAALKIQKTFKKIGKQKTKFGTFKLEVKIGLSIGKVDWKIVKTDSVSGYFFRGKAINDAALCEQQAFAGEIITDKRLYKISNANAKHKKNGFYIIKNIADNVESIKTKSAKKQKYINDFVPKSVTNLRFRGEFRDVISCFISFDETTDFENNLRSVIQLSQEYGGYFNKIDFGDKGGVILVVFGAPVSHERIYRRACDFAFAVNELPDFLCKIGLSFGLAFAGFTGSMRRSEYTVLGMAVNLAARYMMKAEFGQIFIDRFINKEVGEIYETKDMGKTQFKGFSEKIQTFTIISKLTEVSETKFYGEFIGREVELKLLKIVSNSREFGNIIYIRGNAGVGKSRLVYETKNAVNNYIYLPCDEILQKSFNPFQYFLKEYFEQTEKPDKKNFDYIYDNLLHFISKKKLQKELIRTKSFIGSILGLHWKDSLFEQLDAKQKYENILYGIRNFFVALSLTKPLVLHLENAHKIDEDSKQLFEVLFNNPDEYSINFVVSCRSNDDGTEFKLDSSNLKQTEITLQNFGTSDSTKIIASLMNTKSVPGKTADLIYSKTSGNPFFTEQLVSFLTEKEILNDKCEIVKTEFDIPANINSVILARLDKLSPALKEVTKTASVLGTRFKDQILGSMMGKEEIKAQMMEGEKEDLWVSSASSHTFQNDMIRESAYQLILKKDIRELHEKAANSIYNVFSEQIEEHYADLTYNYQNAEILDKAVYYLEKAGDYAKEMYQNTAALGFYEKLLVVVEKMENKPIKILLNVKLNIAELLLLNGQPERTELILSELVNTDIPYTEISDRLQYVNARSLVMKADYTKLKEFLIPIIDDIKTELYRNHLELYYLDALRFLNEDFIGEAAIFLKELRHNKNKEFEAKLLNVIGVYYLHKSQYMKAMKHFHLNYEIVDELNDMNLVRMALHNIGVVSFRMGDSDKAEENYKKALKIAQKIGNKDASGKIISDIGAMYSRDGEFKKAIKYYKHGLEIAKTVGNKMQEGLILFNIANAYHYLDKYNRSIKFLMNSKDICEQISDVEGITYANDLYGDNLYRLEKIAQAKEIYTENLKLQEKINDKEGMSHTYGNLGNIAKAEKNFDEAETYYNKQQKILSKIGDKEGEGKAYFNWAMIEIERKNPVEAIPKLHKALELFKKCNFKIGLDLAKEQLKGLMGH